MYCCLHCVCVYMSKKFKKLLNIHTHIHKIICSTYAFSIHKAYLTNNYQCTSFAFYANTPHSLPFYYWLTVLYYFSLQEMPQLFGNKATVWYSRTKYTSVQKCVLLLSIELRCFWGVSIHNIQVKIHLVLKLAFLRNIAQTYKNNLYGNMLFDKPAGVPTTN